MNPRNLKSVLCEIETHCWFVTHVPVQVQKGQRELHYMYIQQVYRYVCMYVCMSVCSGLLWCPHCTPTDYSPSWPHMASQQSQKQVEPIKIKAPGDLLMKVLERIGENKKLGLTGRPTRHFAPAKSTRSLARRSSAIQQTPWLTFILHLTLRSSSIRSR